MRSECASHRATPVGTGATVGRTYGGNEGSVLVHGTGMAVGWAVAAAGAGERDARPTPPLAA